MHKSFDVLDVLWHFIDAVDYIKQLHDNIDEIRWLHRAACGVIYSTISHELI